MSCCDPNESCAVPAKREQEQTDMLVKLALSVVNMQDKMAEQNKKIEELEKLANAINQGAGAMIKQLQDQVGSMIASGGNVPVELEQAVELQEN